MDINRSLLVIGGSAPPQSWIHRQGNFFLICAADSGLDMCTSWHITPDIIVGDMDSISDPALIDCYPKAEVLLALEDKDKSDTELGLDLLISKGASNIAIAGGGEGRLDHLLAIRGLFDRSPRPTEWHTSQDSVYLVPEGKRVRFSCPQGALVSIFPLSKGASGICSKHLKWPLDGLAWTVSDFSLSNRTTMPFFELAAGKGDLLVIGSLDMTAAQVE